MLQPSHDLRDLASAQLRSMFEVLARVSPADACTWRACVYTRRADSLEAPQIRLQRVACWPARLQQPTHQWQSPPATAGPFNSSPTPSNDAMDELLTLHRPAWEGGSSSSACDAETSLIQEEIVLLPSSNMLVLPLAEAGVLVGLLVVEVAAPINLQQVSSNPSGSGTSSPAAAISEDALWCLRMAVAPLAKACAMDIRTALAGAQHEAQQRLARSLLTEARGPLKVLGTFGAMLAPRLKADPSSQPESDMADGMLMQGQRLADVVAQLEAALRPTAVVDALAATTASQLPALPGGTDHPSAGDPWLHEDEDDDFLVASDSSNPQWQQQTGQQKQLCSPVAPVRGQLAAASGRNKGYLPEHCSRTAATAAVESTDSSKSRKSNETQQQRAPQLPSLWDRPAGPLASSSRDIRWKQVQPERASSSPASNTMQNSSSSRRASSDDGMCSAFYSPALSTASEIQRTIDLEPVMEDSTPYTPLVATQSSADSDSSDHDLQSEVVESANTTSLSSSSSTELKHQAAKQSAQCNLIDALSHLLTAAARLAQMQGVNFIVNHPLQLDSPHPTATTTTVSSSDSSSDSDSVCVTGPFSPWASADSSTQSVASSSTDAALTLLPRPLRPLLVGLAAGSCRRILGYVLDVALQCTPRGGQLCVTARQCSGGVEVNVLHTGHAQSSRLHTTSRTLNPKQSTQPHSEASFSSSSTSQRRRMSSSVSSRRSRSARGDFVTAVPVQSDAAVSKRMSISQGLAADGGLQGSSSLVSLDFAGQLLKTVGGRLAVVYPCHFMNAITGQLEVGSSIEMWLPPPQATQ